MKKGKNFIFITISLLLSIILFVNVPISYAAIQNSDVLERVFVYPFEEPQVDGHHGYINILLQGKNNTSNYSVRTYAFSATDYSNDWHVDFKIYTGSDVFSIIFAGSSGMHVDTYYSNNGTCVTDETIYNSGNYFSYDFSSVWDIVSYSVCFPDDRYSCSWITENVTNFTVLWAPDSALYSELVLLSDLIDSVNTKLSTLNTTTSTISTNLSTVITKLNNITASLSNIKNDTGSLVNLLNQLNSNLTSLNSDLLDLKSDVNMGFGNINDSIDRLIEKIDVLVDIYNSEVPEDDQIRLDDLEINSDNQSDEIKDNLDILDDESNNRPDPDDIGESVDDVIEEEEENIDKVGEVFSDVFENQIILKMLLIVCTIATISYVLFGKK